MLLDDEKISEILRDLDDEDVTVQKLKAFLNDAEQLTQQLTPSEKARLGTQPGSIRWQENQPYHLTDENCQLVKYNDIIFFPAYRTHDSLLNLARRLYQDYRHGLQVQQTIFDQQYQQWKQAQIDWEWTVLQNNRNSDRLTALILLDLLQQTLAKNPSFLHLTTSLRAYRLFL
ncbi:hypothetical protein DTO212C5_6727 [Paecilomyces variotii]|nr:hypothetical protein DTO212C5_6727 [Paecilomyces variotii]